MDSDTDIEFQRRQRYYRGRAQIRFEHLDYEDENVPGGTSADPKRVERLIDKFKHEGCLRLEQENWVPALVDEQALLECLEGFAIPQAHILDFRKMPPKLELPDGAKVVLLHGKHRVEAAKHVLEPRDHWWVIELYSNGMCAWHREVTVIADMRSAIPEEEILHLRTEFTSARSFSDGDLYRHLRHYQRLDDTIQTGKWQARLSPSKRRDVKILLSKHNDLAVALDRLLPFTGLWGSVQLGTLHRILSLNCDEVSSMRCTDIVKR
jgi:hypothetical protein